MTPLVLRILCLSPVVAFLAHGASSGLPRLTPGYEPPVHTHATGTFEVQLTPQTPAPGISDTTLGRLALVKQYHGDLEGTSRGEMLTAMTAEKGSAGYVALERVHGTLQGRGGTFALQHSGLMNRGAPSLTITVVSGSGTGDLVGLAGTMSITIADGRHSYDLEYTLPPAP